MDGITDSMDMNLSKLQELMVIEKPVVLEKTPESPLASKEIKPVNPKGNQS